MGRKAEVQRMQLEKLMGPEAMGTATTTLHFTDDKVCRNFLCGTCPHDLFSNTKVDLGTCPKSHTARLKDEYDAAVAKGEAFPAFEVEHEDSIRTFMADIDRKIAANKRRIDISPEETAKFTTLLRDIQDVDAAVAAAEKEVERLGEAGQIDESLAELQKVEALKQEKADRERELQVLSDSAGASGHQKLRVCDVCGAYLSILDSDRRLADHFGGRMHLGYLKLREVITAFDERRAAGKDPRLALAAQRSNGAPPPMNGHGGPPGGGGYGAPPPPQAGGYGYRPPPQHHADYAPPADSGYARRGPPAGPGMDRDRRRERSPPPRSSGYRDDRDRDRGGYRR
ncbi:LUC7-domain-containing protein [Tilletiopsis washingtonensis]|uniref:LUC7-domain-containing protein n=1 Tax=Tilletiopsis washingtonensis TaxID=58919 RepID=A0A316ZGA7_9BASI|nr:LUC7-domain-containing protein [Tilletiopsis washingtonensis]PWO00277.1 LUC7-domain-containing protein [Tilletiopsis washingtonensis]